MSNEIHITPTRGYEYQTVSMETTRHELFDWLSRPNVCNDRDFSGLSPISEIVKQDSDTRLLQSDT